MLTGPCKFTRVDVLHAVTMLWDPWGLFFIHLTHKSEMSNYKGINSGWMNLGWISFLLVFSMEIDDIQSVFFHTAKE